jgi:hypothetical protein
MGRRGGAAGVLLRYAGIFGGAEGDGGGVDEEGKRGNLHPPARQRPVQFRVF